MACPSNHVCAGRPTSQQATGNPAWLVPIAFAAAGLVVMTGLFWQTAASAVDLWWGRSTYNHVFLIAPISAYMVWQRRVVVAREIPSGSFWGVALAAAFALCWLVADVAEIDEGRHFAFVGMLQGLLLACFGWRVCRRLALPILYLWLLVPTGEFLLPPLQDLATDISSPLVQWLGIPIYREGVYVEVPTGVFHIAPGCAGLNFVLATIAILPLYVELFYGTAWKQVLAVAVALPLAIIMNGVRIAAIIAINHWTGGNISIVDDHLLYGWGLFAVLLFAVGYLGTLIADPAPEGSAAPATAAARARPGRRVAAAGAASLLVMTAASFYGAAANARAEPSLAVSLRAPARIADWSPAPWPGDWSPAFSGSEDEFRQSYALGDERVDLFVAYYSAQQEGSEMISFANRLVDEEAWRIVERSPLGLETESGTVALTGLVAESRSGRRHIWFTYWVDGVFTNRRLTAKLLEARAKLALRDQAAATVAVSTPETTDRDRAEARLRAFLRALPAVRDLVAR